MTIFEGLYVYIACTISRHSIVHFLKHDHLPSIISSEYSSNVQKFVSFFANLKYGVREKD
ncbi:MAG: hypothetical protein WCF97_00575, partial [Nitrososphaeraceae archaeon]